MEFTTYLIDTYNKKHHRHQVNGISGSQSAREKLTHGLQNQLFSCVHDARKQSGQVSISII